MKTDNIRPSPWLEVHKDVFDKMVSDLADRDAEIARLKAAKTENDALYYSAMHEIAELNAEIARLRAGQSVADDYVLVPKEPTATMLDAMRVGSRKDCPSDELCRVRYAALLQSAPPAPAVSGVEPRYGCHFDLEPHMHPDGCVIDDDRRHDCIYAIRGIQDKTQCDWWRPITITTAPAVPSDRAKNSEFLLWIADRLVHVYGENPNVDFVLKLRALSRHSSAPDLQGSGWQPIYQIKGKLNNVWSEVSKARYDFYRASPELGIVGRVVYLPAPPTESEE